MVEVFKKRIVPQIPRGFWIDLEEQFTAAFAEAHRLTINHFSTPEHKHILPQLRHGRCEAGFRSVSEKYGLEVGATDTIPAGGRYSLAKAGDVILLRANIQRHFGPPRPTKFRREKAALNAWLNPVQMTLWGELATAPSDRLCGLIIVTAPYRFRDPMLPAFIGLGLPQDDLKRWLFLSPVDEILSLYEDVHSHKAEPVIRIKDRVKPRLKANAEN